MKPLLLLVLTGFTTVFVFAGEKKKIEPDQAFKVHPKVFSMVDCWISDSQSPVVTEINLDAVKANGNEFDESGMVLEDEWTRSPGTDGLGFLRYRVLEVKGNHYKVEHQANGGGTLTSASIIEFTLENREIRKNGKPVPIHVLRVISCEAK